MDNKICIIEDDIDLANLIKEHLEKYDFKVSICEDFKNIIGFITEKEPDLILLDINIPYYDGFYWCKEIRKITVVPIIFMSARAEDYDQVRAIMSGGDDYIVKPFSYDLLIAKVNSHFRRAYGEYANKESASITCGNCNYDKFRLTLECNGETTDLSKNESILISLLFCNFPNIVKREKILSEIWDAELFVEENTLNVTISRIRKKMTDLKSNVQVVTVRGVGYKLEYIDESK